MANFGDYQTSIYAEGMFNGKAPEIATGLSQLEAQARRCWRPRPSATSHPARAAGPPPRPTGRRSTAGGSCPHAAARPSATCRPPSSARRCPPRWPSPPSACRPSPTPRASWRPPAAAAVGLPYIHSCAASHTRAGGRGRRRRGPALVPAVLADRPGRVRQLPVPRPGGGLPRPVVTLDTTTLGWRPADLDRGFLPFLRGEGIATYLSDPAFRAGLSRPPEDDPAGRSCAGRRSSPTRA